MKQNQDNLDACVCVCACTCVCIYTPELPLCIHVEVRRKSWMLIHTSHLVWARLSCCRYCITAPAGPGHFDGLSTLPVFRQGCWDYRFILPFLTAQELWISRLTSSHLVSQYFTSTWAIFSGLSHGSRVVICNWNLEVREYGIARVQVEVIILNWAFKILCFSEGWRVIWHSFQSWVRETCEV